MNMIESLNSALDNMLEVHDNVISSLEKMLDTSEEYSE